MNDRVLPHNLEAEKAVLGAVLVHPDLLPRAQQVLQPDDFFRRAHQAIFAAMIRLSDEKRSELDLVTLKHELQKSGDLTEVGGAAYITALTDGVPHSTNVGHYAAIVKEQAVRRALIRTANHVLEEAYTSGDVQAIITKADQQIIDVQRGAGSGRMVDLRETSSQLYTDLEWRSEHKGELLGCETGFQSINELTNGWQGGDMVVIAARPSIGKTAFVLNTAAAAARTGKHVAIFSLEMRRRQLEYRMLASLSGVQLSRILGGWLGDIDFERLAPALSELSTLPIMVDDRGGQTVWDIRATARRLKAEKQLDLLVLDYVQLVAGSLDRRGATRTEELTDISRRLKVLADEVACPVLVLSQLSRAGETRSDKRPLLSDLRDTGALEQDADLVCFLHRKHHRESGETSFIIEKQRNGPTGTVLLSIDRDTQVFVDAGLEPEQAPLPVPEPVQEPKPPKGWRRG